MTNGLPMGHRSFRPKWRSVCRTASFRGLARMGDPDASVIPAARDFREGHHAVARLSEHLGVVATLHSSRSRFFQQKEVRSGKLCNWGPRYDGELPVSHSNWRFVCKDCSCGLRCNYNLSILLTFSGDKISIISVRYLNKSNRGREAREISLHCKLRLYLYCHYLHYC